MKKSIAIIGGGPAGLMLAAKLDSTKYEISIYEKNQTCGRKLLVAGQGGFNLTHSEPGESFLSRYTPSTFLEPSFKTFSNTNLREWLDSIGIPTYIGSSKRVFPEKGIKPIQVLNAILKVLEENGVRFHFSHSWTGWSANKELLFSTSAGSQTVKADYVVFALGGGSWKVTGSDGAWATKFEEAGIKVLPLQASNCAFGIQWPASLPPETEGKPLKNISITCGKQTKEGEVTITKFGLEGSGIYALSPPIRDSLNQTGKAILYLDLKPGLDLTEITTRLKNRRANRSLTKHLAESLNLDETKLSFVKSCVSKEIFQDPVHLAQHLKHLPLTIHTLAPIDEAISTVGGISLEEVSKHFELKKLPNTFVIGEMLDWDAPTGGYLLQGCFSMGVGLALYMNNLNP